MVRHKCHKYVWLLLALAVTLLWWRGGGGVEGYTDQENDAWLRERMAELRAHLATVDPELAEFAAAVKDVELLKDQTTRQLPNGKMGYNSGRFKHSTGVMSVGGRDGRLRERSRGAMLMTLLHEIAHAGIGPTNLAEGTPHGEEWNGVWRRLLAHATGHLGWDVEVRCAECTYYNLCSKKQCPGCSWMQETCAPYAGGSPSDFRKKAAHAAL